jgi:hypothetical protein
MTFEMPGPENYADWGYSRLTELSSVNRGGITDESCLPREENE